MIMRSFFFGLIALHFVIVALPAHVKASEFLTLYDAVTGEGNFAGLSFGIFAATSMEDIRLSSHGGFGNIEVHGDGFVYGGGFSTGYDLTYMPYDLGFIQVPWILQWWSGLQLGLSLTVMIPGETPTASLPTGPPVQFPMLGLIDRDTPVDGGTVPRNTPFLSMTLTEEIRLSLLARLGIVSFDYVSLFGLLGYSYSKAQYDVHIPVSSVNIDARLEDPLTLAILRANFRPLRGLNFPTNFQGVAYGGGLEVYMLHNLSLQFTALWTYYPTVQHEEQFLLRFLPSVTPAPQPIFFIQRSSGLLKAELVYRF